MDAASKPGRHPPPPLPLAAAELLRGMGERERRGEGGRTGGRKGGGEGLREGEWKGGGDLLSEERGREDARPMGTRPMAAIIGEHTGSADRGKLQSG